MFQFLILSLIFFSVSHANENKPIKLEQKYKVGTIIKAENGKPVKSIDAAMKLYKKDRESHSSDNIDIGNILKQARMVPNRNPETGEIDGYVLMSIEANSQWEKMGFKEGDILTEEEFRTLLAK